MKLRLMANTLRMRLSQSEVDKLGETGRVIDSTIFPGNKKISYEIKSTSSNYLTCGFVDETITLNVPQRLVNEWVNTEMVGFNDGVKINNQQKLNILVEKDFKCLTKRSEENEDDLFPNPLKSH